MLQSAVVNLHESTQTLMGLNEPRKYYSVKFSYFHYYINPLYIVVDAAIQTDRRGRSAF